MNGHAPPDASSSPDEAFDLFFRAHLDRLVRFLLRRTDDRGVAEDLATDVGLQLWLKFGEAHNPQALMFRIASRQASNWRRSQGRKPLIELREDMTELSAVLAEREFGSGKSLQRGLHYAVLELPPRQQQAISLHFLDDLEFHEIAGLMGITPSSVQRTISRGLDTLRKSDHLAAYRPVIPEVRQ